MSVAAWPAPPPNKRRYLKAAAPSGSDCLGLGLPTSRGPRPRALGERALAKQAGQTVGTLTAAFSCPSTNNSGRLPTSQRNGGPAHGEETASAVSLQPRTRGPHTAQKQLPALPHLGCGGSATA